MEHPNSALRHDLTLHHRTHLSVRCRRQIPANGSEIAWSIRTSVASAVEPMSVASLRPHPGNARTHSKKQIRQIAESARWFGFTNPILVGQDGEILAGHGRVEAPKLLGMDRVPT